MAGTVIISQSGSSITVYHNRYNGVRKSNPVGEHWCFSLNLERYRYKKAQPRIRYNAEIVAQRIEYSHPKPSEISEEIVIYRSHRRGLNLVFNKAHTLLQSLLQAIDNGYPVWDVRELI